MKIKVNKRKFKCNKNNSNFMNHKGMGVGQVFIFILAAVTFSLIMIFGYKSIVQFISRGEQVEYVQFKTDLESSVKKIYTEFGSRRIEDFTLPDRFQQICFVDLDALVDEEQINSLCNYDQAACLAWKDAQEVNVNTIDQSVSGYNIIDQNVFLKPAPEEGKGIKVYKISIDNNGLNFLCVPIKNGHFKLLLEGLGDKTRLSIPNLDMTD